MNDKDKLDLVINKLRETIWKEYSPAETYLARDILSLLDEPHGDEARQLERHQAWEAQRPIERARLEERCRQLKLRAKLEPDILKGLAKYINMKLNQELISIMESEANVMVKNFLMLNGENPIGEVGFEVKYNTLSLVWRGSMNYYPPNYYKSSAPLIFLAGPIQGAPDWQSEAIKYIRYNLQSNIDIANPRVNLEAKDFDSNKQIKWESYHLEAAAKKGGILFWLAKEEVVISGRAYAQTSRFELGEWLAKYQDYNRYNFEMAIGIEPGFTGEKYIRHRVPYSIDINDNLKDTCSELIYKLS